MVHSYISYQVCMDLMKFIKKKLPVEHLTPHGHGLRISKKQPLPWVNLCKSIRYRTLENQKVSLYKGPLQKKSGLPTIIVHLDVPCAALQISRTNVVGSAPFLSHCIMSLPPAVEMMVMYGITGNKGWFANPKNVAWTKESCKLVKV